MRIMNILILVCIIFNSTGTIWSETKDIGDVNYQNLIGLNFDGFLNNVYELTYEKFLLDHLSVQFDLGGNPLVNSSLRFVDLGILARAYPLSKDLSGLSVGIGLKCYLADSDIDMSNISSGTSASSDISLRLLSTIGWRFFIGSFYLEPNLEILNRFYLIPTGSGESGKPKQFSYNSNSFNFDFSLGFGF